MEVVGTSNTNSITIPITDPNDEMWFAVSAKNDTEGWESERSRAKFYGGGILDCTIGISENAFDNALSVYPNPATNEVYISLSDKTFNNFDITIANSLGQILERKTNVDNASRATINVSNYSSGIYFVTIKAGESISTKKLVVQ